MSELLFALGQFVALFGGFIFFPVCCLLLYVVARP